MPKGKPAPSHSLSNGMAMVTSLVVLRNTETESKASQRSQDVCVQAANKITAIVTAYMEKFSIRKAPVFLSYYVFTASITHVATRAFSL